MPATVSSLIDTVRLRVDNSALSDTQLLDILNNANRWAQRTSPLHFNEKELRQSVSTAASSLQTLVLPTDMSEPIQLYALVSGEYHPVAYREDTFTLIADYAGATAAKEPVWWTQWGNSGLLFPVLSSALNTVLFYEAQLVDFTSNTSTNNLVSNFPEVLEYAGTAEYYDTLAETTRADVWRAKAAKALKDLLYGEQAVRNRAKSAVPTTVGTLYRGV